MSGVKPTHEVEGKAASDEEAAARAQRQRLKRLKIHASMWTAALAGVRQFLWSLQRCACCAKGRDFTAKGRLHCRCAETTGWKEAVKCGRVQGQGVALDEVGCGGGASVGGGGSGGGEMNANTGENDGSDSSGGSVRSGRSGGYIISNFQINHFSSGGVVGGGGTLVHTDTKVFCKSTCGGGGAVPRGMCSVGRSSVYHWWWFLRGAGAKRRRRESNPQPCKKSQVKSLSTPP